jgi:hypothetical protein
MQQRPTKTKHKEDKNTKSIKHNMNAQTNKTQKTQKHKLIKADNMVDSETSLTQQQNTSNKCITKQKHNNPQHATRRNQTHMQLQLIKKQQPIGSLT